MNLYQCIEKGKEYLSLAKKFKLTAEEKQRGAIELAALIAQIADDIQTDTDKRISKKRARLVNDKNSRDFLNQFTDQSIRTQNPSRIISHSIALLNEHGMPKALPLSDKLALAALKTIGPMLPSFSARQLKEKIKEELSELILPGDEAPLKKQLSQLENQGIRINLNHLVEDIISEKQAEKELAFYLGIIKRPDVPAVSIKLSSLHSQISLLAWKQSKEILKERLTTLYSTAMQHAYITAKGEHSYKRITLDMEHYEHIEFTLDTFKETLEQDSLKQAHAGIVIQAYTPESYAQLDALLNWAEQRKENGGTPIHIRIVKGANLAMEKVQASTMNWPLPLYRTKAEVDANFKRLIHLASSRAHKSGVEIGIGSHNIFDIAYTLLERAEKNCEELLHFEMLYGMAEPLRKALQIISNDILVYCPTAAKTQFSQPMSYLMRRLDENTSPEHFLTHSYSMSPGNTIWQKEAEKFRYSHSLIKSIHNDKFRVQNRKEIEIKQLNEFRNNARTDLSIKENRSWALNTLALASTINKEKADETHENQLEITVKKSSTAFEKWKNSSISQRSALLKELAKAMETQRQSICALIIHEIKMPFSEADAEISDAIDSLLYYSDSFERVIKKFPGLSFSPKGTMLLDTEWNSPLATPISGIAASLITGNAAILMPSPLSSHIATRIIDLCKEAGLPEDLVQLAHSKKDTEQVEYPNLTILSETAEKNSVIITAMADKELAIKHTLHSAFSFSGQKNTSASLLFLEAELYDDEEFIGMLKEACISLAVGSQLEPTTLIGPLIQPASNSEKNALTECSPNDSWLLQPEQDINDPCLYSPGLKFITEQSPDFHTVYTAPLLGIVRVDSLDHAIEIANRVNSDTASLHSLDKAEQTQWTEQITASNLYINKSAADALVGRQPKTGLRPAHAASFKSGSDEYLLHFLNYTEKANRYSYDNIEKKKENKALLSLVPHEQRKDWAQCITQYKQAVTEALIPTQLQDIVGEENSLRYKIPKAIILRLSKEQDHYDQCRMLYLLSLLNTKIQISIEEAEDLHLSEKELQVIGLRQDSSSIIESEAELCKRLSNTRTLYTSTTLSQESQGLIKDRQCRIVSTPITDTGLIEVMSLLNSQSLSQTQHRYGYLSNKN